VEWSERQEKLGFYFIFREHYSVCHPVRAGILFDFQKLRLSPAQGEGEEKNSNQKRPLKIEKSQNSSLGLFAFRL
jgi:hypothetical protein